MGWAVEITEQTTQVRRTLCGDVIKVDGMTNDMDQCEQEAQAGNVLVHTNGRIKRDELVQECFPQLGDQVPTHG